VCVVRAEPQGDNLLISVSANTDIEHRTPTKLYGNTTDVARTLDLVAQFLTEVAVRNAMETAVDPGSSSLE
jgi:hypothetical protein